MARIAAARGRGPGYRARTDVSARDEITHVFRWDLDKTYLHTNFDTVVDLLRTAVERPERKRTVPGAASLMREIRASGAVRITIVSGSPEQMRRSLEAKLRLDGVQWDELVLKPNLRNILKFRFRAVREQVGYKLPTLLSARSRAPEAARETLFGDDAEADALVYSLYADVLGGRIGEDTLQAVLEKAGAYPDAIASVRKHVATLSRTDPVRRIFIHLDRKSDPTFFRRYGPRVVPISNYFQAALVLVSDKTIPPEAGLRHAASLVIEHDFDVPDLLAVARDVVGRGHVSAEALQAIADCARTIAEPFPLVSYRRGQLAEGLLACIPYVALPPEPVSVDYLAAFADDRARWEAAKLRAKRDAQR
jgi:hypothetical protein